MTTNYVLPHMPYSGTCLCKQITVTLPGHPTSSALCHCSNCRTTAGSLFQATFLVPSKDVTITGTPTVYEDGRTTSGAKMLRSFCGSCGS